MGLEKIYGRYTWSNGAETFQLRIVFMTFCTMGTLGLSCRFQIDTSIYTQLTGLWFAQAT